MRAFRRAPTGELLRAATTQGWDVPKHAINFDLPAIVTRLIDACPEALLERNTEDETPFQARLAALQRAKEHHKSEHTRNEQESTGTKMSEAEHVAQLEEDRLQIIEKDEILSYMREYIIDKFDRRRAMKALYRVGDGKNSMSRTTRAKIANERPAARRTGPRVRSLWSSIFEDQQ